MNPMSSKLLIVLSFRTKSTDAAAAAAVDAAVAVIPAGDEGVGADVVGARNPPRRKEV